MKNNMKIPLKVFSLSAFFLILLAVLSCTLDILPPDTMRFNLKLNVHTTSSTGRDSIVANAKAIVQSITYRDYYETTTDSNGVVVFPNLIPDRYNIQISYNRGSLVDDEIVMTNAQLNDSLLYSGIEDTLTLNINATTYRYRGTLVISEIYYTGAIPRPVPQYFHDQFTEIYNNSSLTIYLDSLIIADVEYGFADDSVIHAVHAYMFPGDGDDYPIEPGQLIVVAQDAIDHSPYPINSVNLLDADFEYYVADKGDVDNNSVTNMIQLHHKYGVDFLYSVFNNAVLLMKVQDPFKLGYDGFNRILLPKGDVIDGVEYRDNVTEMNMKRVDGSIDGGLTGGIPAYSSQSVERYIDRYEEGRMILMDNNNSSLDFHVLKPPTPGFIQEEVAE